jgi:enolase
MQIVKVDAKEIPDSRGELTLEVEIYTKDFSAKASVPSGRSVGKYEAKPLDILLAKKAIDEILPSIASRDFSSQEEFDSFLCKIDGTKDKSRLGANTILALSIAAARVFAKERGLELWQFIKELSNTSAEPKQPFLFLNLINGGLHAKNSTDVQEYLIVVSESSGEKSIHAAKKIFFRLHEIFKREFPSSGIIFGDEGGIVIQNQSNELPLKFLAEATDGLENVRLGLDVAASTFFEDGKYRWENRIIASKELMDVLFDWAQKYSLFSIEDPFAEEDEKSFAIFMEQIKDLKEGILIIGDDLTATNQERIVQASKNNLINGVIIKPNQIGTVTETIGAIKSAHKLGLKTIVSHRSGETMDDFISDLALGAGAFGFKAGAPTQPERLVKYNRLIEIENSG